jgi:hypothetical protein
MTETVTVPMRPHPAKFTDLILESMRVRINDEYRRLNNHLASADRTPILVFDPFAGVGRIHRLHRDGRVHTDGMEIEPEWGGYHPRTRVGDALEWMTSTSVRYHVVTTSPCYGNRFSDCHDARDSSERHSYKHDLGRMPTEGSNATFPWGPRYWRFMGEFYRLVDRVLLPGGLFLLNVSNFQRAKVMVNAVPWHAGACWGVGLEQDLVHEPTLAVPTPRMRNGENHEARAESEVILRFRKPEIGRSA